MNFHRSSDQQTKRATEFFKYFTFDEQTCVMKFGSWTYAGFQVRYLAYWNSDQQTKQMALDSVQKYFS